jgi:site-specific DNA recombinase
MIRQRCAIYTRKSTEEGLEQSFNSLDAQREACAAYILSQKHEGWAELSDRYDDGGFSGGSMERPGLQQLLEDVRAGRIDVIVVYKVDRLTRALSDFAKMVDVFDGAGVSFVSVTQAFNTTSSMGRLTLNVLLSFAQFEREVTAERIRDKVAASKRKGMWMGGAIPLGYDVEDKALVVSPTEATAIRTIFAEYLALGSVRQLRARLDALGIVSKQRTNRFGRVSGGTTFSRGALYNILRNPIYIGKVRHKEELHEGLHEAIIDDATWKLVQTQLADHGGKKIRSTRRPATRLLDGVLFDAKGRAMRTTYASKSIHTDGTTRTKRYWYYTTAVRGSEDKTEIERLPADEIERVVMNALNERLADMRWLADQINGQVRETTAVCILRTIEQRVVEDDMTNVDAQIQDFLSIIDRIDTHKIGWLSR